MMFEQITMVDVARRSSPWSFAASLTVQSVLVAAALAWPMMRVAKIDTRPPGILFLPRSIGSPEPVKKTAPRGSASSALTILQASRTYRAFQWPSRIPSQVATGPDLPGAPEYGVGVGAGNGDPSGPLTALPELGQKELVLPPAQLQKAPQTVTQPVQLRVGEGVQAARLVFGPKPVYPPLAKQARISGTVRLAAQISAGGHIRDLRVLSGHPMLAPAAIEAVSQWVYKPTLLNGQPVEVLTDILVNFVLNQ